jgi:hypothetical protein
MPNTTVSAAGGAMPAAAITPAGMPAGMDPADWRRAVEARIEDLLDASWRLMDALNSMEVDPDLEPDDEGEPGTWPEAADWVRQTDKIADENREDDDPAEDDGGGIGDAEGLQEQTGMGEPDLGWTTAINQEIALAPPSLPWAVDDGEPSLGWTGYGRGVAEGETTDDREGDDEREEDPAEAGIADSDAFHAVF